MCAACHNNWQLMFPLQTSQMLLKWRQQVMTMYCKVLGQRALRHMVPSPRFQQSPTLPAL